MWLPELIRSIYIIAKGRKETPKAFFAPMTKTPGSVDGIMIKEGTDCEWAKSKDQVKSL